MKSAIVFLFFIFFLNESAFSQSEHSNSKNSLDIQLLGNKGFASIGYNRTLLRSNKFEWLAGPAIGYVPSSREDTAQSIPRFLHLNIGTYVSYGMGLLRPTLGVSYSKIVLGDPYHARAKKSYNRVLGDIGCLINIKNAGIAIKVAYTPMLSDDGAEDVENIPYAFVIRVLL